MADDSIKVEYKIKEVTAKLNEQHDTILLTEIVEFCGRNDLLEYKVSVDTLREALNFYFEYKNRQKGKWIDYQVVNSGFSKCSQCNAEFDWDDNCSMYKWNFCPHCGAEMRGVAKDSLWDKAIKADDIKKDDEWMQDDKWDKIYKEDKQ